MRSKFCSSGGWGASTPAKSAMITIASAKTAPTTTTVLRASRRRPFVRARPPAAGRRRGDRATPSGAALGRTGDGPRAGARRVVAWSYKVTAFALQAKGQAGGLLLEGQKRHDA